MPDADDLIDLPDGWWGACLRFVWWVVWDLCCELIAWSVGWPVCRLLSAGRFPAVGFTGAAQAGWWEELLVILIGFAVLALALWGVAG